MQAGSKGQSSPIAAAAVTIASTPHTAVARRARSCGPVVGWAAGHLGLFFTSTKLHQGRSENCVKRKRCANAKQTDGHVIREYFKLLSSTQD